MTVIPHFLQRMGRGGTSVSFDEPRPLNNGTRPGKRHSLDMESLSRKSSVFSPKFFAKISWVDTLSQLATMVPLNQVSIPQAVYE
ncbi:hypothetical protein GGI06_000217 [Coemansia sp. S85]|nr:hypothetical protein GGI06_000217 [Coemansia sp. S85]